LVLPIVDGVTGSLSTVAGSGTLVSGACDTSDSCWALGSQEIASLVTSGTPLVRGETSFPGVPGLTSISCVDPHTCYVVGGKSTGKEGPFVSAVTGVLFTLADGRTADRQDVYGASKFTGNAEVYWENQVFSARVAYNYRSKYLQGLVTGVPEYDDAVGDLALSLNYKLGDTVTFTFDGLNLNNPTLKSYGFSRDMPIGRYVNGRQYYFGVRLTF